MFVTFEGIDGSGKSTALASVAAALATEGLECWQTREETDYLGAAIRRSIEQRASPLATTMLFVADRFRHLPELQKHLMAGEVVLCDRFMHSTLAYQGVALEGKLDNHHAWLRTLHAPMDPLPDLVLWFDVPADVAMARAEQRGATAPYEKADFLERVRVQYARLAAEEPNLIVRIDATRTPIQVASDALQAMHVKRQQYLA